MGELEHMIYLVRGQRVMLDSDLAMFYGVETRDLNKAMKRNLDRFPEDFAFQLSKSERENLMFQFGTSSLGSVRNLSLPIVTSTWGGWRKLPWVFTEHGVVMLANVLRSKKAVHMSIEVVRVFVKMRHVLASQEKLNRDFTELKSFLLKRFNETDREFKKVWQAIEKLSPFPVGSDRRIGFDLS